MPGRRDEDEGREVEPGAGLPHVELPYGEAPLGPSEENGMEREHDPEQEGERQREAEEAGAGGDREIG